MATAIVNGVRLFYELSGTGKIPLILVHGSALSHAEVVTFLGSGHIPHLTHPDTFVDTIMNFIGKYQA